MPSWFPQAPCSAFPELFIIVPEIVYVMQYYKLYDTVSPPQSANNHALFISVFLEAHTMLKA